MELSTTALIADLNRGGFKIEVARVPLPLVFSGETLSSKALCGLYLEPIMGGGHHAWILISWDYIGGSHTPSYHEFHLARAEPREHSIVWSLPIPAYAWRSEDGRTLRMLRFRASEPDLQPWTDSLPLARQEGGWLQTLLPPPSRRVPCALRLHEPAAPLQTWLKI